MCRHPRQIKAKDRNWQAGAGCLPRLVRFLHLMGVTCLRVVSSECSPFEIMCDKPTSIEYSAEVDKPELAMPPTCPGWPPAEPPAHGRGWPQGTVPTPIAHAMEFCSENCQLAQCNMPSIDSAESPLQKCRFPQHCSIVPLSPIP